MFTGLHVAEHGVTSDDDALQLGETVFDELADQGYETAAFSENPYLTTLDTGLGSGFDIVEGGGQEHLFDGVDPDEFKGEPGAFLREAVWSNRPFRSIANGVVAKLAWDHPKFLPAGLNRRLGSGVTPGSTYTDLFREWVSETSGPWAACINYMDAHHPYEPLPEHDRWDDGHIKGIHDSITAIPMGFYLGDDPWWKCEVLEYLYDGTIRQVDHEVGRLLSILRERSELSNTLVVVTSDHGEGFGERSPVRGINLAGHNVGTHEVNLHVPLVVKYPDQSDGERVESPVSLTAIPSEIRGVLKGKRRRFDTHRVLARTQGLKDVQLARLQEVGVNTDPFSGDVDVLYEAEDIEITKYLRWGDVTTAERCIDAQVSYGIDGEQPERLAEVVGELELAEVSSTVDREVTKSTKARLEKLGYR
jgi:arylsulfatase A-like enzyme